MASMSETRGKNNTHLTEIKRDILEALEIEITAARNPPPEYIVAQDGARSVVHPEADIGLAEFYEELSAEIGRLRYAVIDLLRLHIAHHNNPIHASARRILPADWAARIDSNVTDLPPNTPH